MEYVWQENNGQLWSLFKRHVLLVTDVDVFEKCIGVCVCLEYYGLNPFHYLAALD